MFKKQTSASRPRAASKFRRVFSSSSDAGLDRNKLFRLSWESESRCWRLPATSGCGLTRPASIASPPHFKRDGFADPARLTATFFTVRLLQSVQHLPSRFISSSTTALGRRLSPLAMSRHRGCVACGHKRTENSVTVASHRFGFFWQFSFTRRAPVT